MSAVLAHIGFDEENILSNIDSVNNSLLTGIFANYIFIKERKGTLVRCSSQADDKGIKILENLIPDVVNRAMAFVNDNAVEEFRRILFVVNDFFRCFGICGNILVKRDFFRGFVQFLSFENGVHSLNGADADLHTVGNIRGLESMYAVNLRKRARIISRFIGKKLSFCLFAKAFGINEEKNTVHFAVFQKSVCGGNSSKSLSGTGSHLHQCFGTIVSKRSIKIFNCCNLTFAESRRIKFRETLHVIADGIGLF